jgi:hypothetical protein
MRQIFKRIDVDIVGATGKEGVERCPIIFVENGAGRPLSTGRAGAGSLGV